MIVFFAMTFTVAILFVPPHIAAFQIHSRNSRSPPGRSVQPNQPNSLYSTPFEADFYGSTTTGEKNVGSTSTWPANVVIGMNKYTHDTSICIADADTGEIVMAQSLERVSRRKHDAGNVMPLVQDLPLYGDGYMAPEDTAFGTKIEKTVGNNHHHRIRPLEENLRHMQWEAGLRINGGEHDGYDEPETNLHVQQELSHHLAHAYSAACQAPFDHGLVVVMDGMGETYRTMQQRDEHYTSDFNGGNMLFKLIPSDVDERARTSYFDWREAESVYTFKKGNNTIDIKPFLKRFCQEKSPPSLYNHGFENMESVGAIYSRASSHIFGDWNACGKVMGLAPWAQYAWPSGKRASLHTAAIFNGHLYEDYGLVYNRSLLEGEPLISRRDSELFLPDGTIKKRYDFDEDIEPTKVALEAIAIAHRVQTDLETIVLDFVSYCQKETKEVNLCLAGGVALNSVLNGRLSRELGFEQTFIPPYPGDDGISVGCCAFGLFCDLKERRPAMWRKPALPYLGPEIQECAIEDAIANAEPWLEVEYVPKDEQRVEMMASEVAAGNVIAWFQGSSEMGPRALGHRSILADPRKKGLIRYINEKVKRRESFRPFAPSVITEEAGNWFVLGQRDTVCAAVSPYMSITAFVRENKRNIIPAVVHVDGSSRLQTVSKSDDIIFYQFLEAFMGKTGIPMVLNTSFNTLPNEPIVESPKDAIRSFLFSMGSIELLVLGDYVIRRKKADLQHLLGQGTQQGVINLEPSCIQRSGSVSFRTLARIDDTLDDDIPPITEVQMPSRPLHGKGNEWFELMDELEGEILAACDGNIDLSGLIDEFSHASVESGPSDPIEETKRLLQNIVFRLVRLYEHTLIYW